MEPRDVQCSRFRASGFRMYLWVLGLGFRVQGLGVQG